MFVRRVTHADYLAAHAANSIPIRKSDGQIVSDPQPEDLMTVEEWDAEYGGDILIQGPALPEGQTPEEYAAKISPLYEWIDDGAGI